MLFTSPHPEIHPIQSRPSVQLKHHGATSVFDMLLAPIRSLVNYLCAFYFYFVPDISGRVLLTMFEVDPCLPDPPLRSIPHFPHLHSNRPNQSKLAENSGLFLLKLILTSHGQHNNKNISRVKNCPEITILSSQIGHCSDRGKAPNLCFRCFLGFVLIRRTQRQDRTEAGCD